MRFRTDDCSASNPKFDLALFDLADHVPYRTVAMLISDDHHQRTSVCLVACSPNRSWALVQSTRLGFRRHALLSRIGGASPSSRRRESADAVEEHHSCLIVVSFAVAERWTAGLSQRLPRRAKSDNPN
jgi:hypothetical protein